MKIVIIEDELLTAEDLKDIILNLVPEAEVVAILSSVKEAIAYFNTQPLPQLIFSDIQLGDGLSFDIFAAINIQVPIIFCTAFDEYAIKAFDANGIHYVLKPFNAGKIKIALDKYWALQQNFVSYNQSVNNVVSSINSGVGHSDKKMEAILVHFQNKIIPIKLEEIALFYVKNETTHLFTFNQETYTISKSLDELQQLNPELFYRANRQYIINRFVVKEATHYQSRKVSLALKLPFDDTITISKEKLSSFLEWLATGKY